MLERHNWRKWGEVCGVCVIKIRYEMRQESGVCNKKPLFICLPKNVGA